jgi:hypothetical protein
VSDLLTDDHAELDGLLRGLTTEFDRGDAGAVLARLDYVWARLAVHIRAEHLHLFPALMAAAEAGRSGAEASEVRATVERLREDHDFFMRELAGAVNNARGLAARAGEDVSAALRQIGERVSAVAGRLAEHNRVEEQEVYRWPEALLGEAARADLGREMRRELENLPPRFSGTPPR